MRRASYTLNAIAVLGLLVSLGAPWWNFALDTGTVLSVTGLNASAPGSSLLGAAAAALGLGFVVRGVLRRLVSLLYVALLSGALVSWAEVFAAPTESVRESLTLLTGLSGESSLGLISAVTTTGFLWVGFVSVGTAVIAGIVGIVMPDRVRVASRYESHERSDDSSDPIVAWDRLSDGDDPTQR